MKRVEKIHMQISRYAGIALFFTGFFFFSCAPFVAAQSTWNETDWVFYDLITIDSANIDENLTDFPVYINLADLSDRFWAMTPSSSSFVATDIRVTTHQGDIFELPRELVAASSTAKTGELHFKANAISSSTETVFRIYYNGTSTGDYAITDTFGAQNVWTNEYVGVYHLGEDGNNDAGGYRDSTQYGNHGTGTSMTSDSDTDGMVGRAQTFDGSSDFITIPDDISNRIGENDFSTVVWVKPLDAEVADTFLSKWYGGSGFNQWVQAIGSPTAGSLPASRKTGYFHIETYAGQTQTAYTTNDVADGNWHMVYLGRAGANDPEIFVDGQLEAVTETLQNGTLPYNINNTEPWVIGNEGGSGGGLYFDGPIDEVRLASTTRSAAWMQAEYINQATTSDFYSTTTNTVALTLDDHDAGQVSSTFTYQNKTDTEFFAFKLATSSPNTVVTNLSVSLIGARKVTASDLDNVELYLDVNNNAAYDSGTDVFVSSGSVTLAGESGSIDFATDFTVSGGGNYIVIGDTVSIVSGAYVTFDLYPSDIVSYATAAGNVFSVQHRRGGGKNAARSYYEGGERQVGTDAPLGNGDVGGGDEGSGRAVDTNSDGDTIGNNPYYNWPSTDSGAWTNGANAYDETDGTYATVDAGSQSHEYEAYGISTGASNRVDGIIVKLEISAQSASDALSVQLSWDGGSSWTTAKNTSSLTTSDTVVSLGGASDKWGRTWALSELSDANFVVRVISGAVTNTAQIDGLQVRVYHSKTGGGSGGGGGI